MQLIDPSWVVRLKPQRRSLLLLLLICVALASVGLWLVAQEIWPGWLLAGLFGIGSLVALVGLLPGSNYLELRPEGLKMCSLYRTSVVFWRDVRVFFPVMLGRQKTVCWFYTDDYKARFPVQNASLQLTGADAGLPDTYGKSAEELADLLNEWRLRQVGSEAEESAQSATQE